MSANQLQANGAKLSLRPREAAEALGISPRLLWTLTKSGEVPHTRIGRAVVYPVDRLREWLAGRCEQKRQGD
jgi:excisionase family DNA binding protein